MKKAIFNSAFAEISMEHPFLATAKFIFADDKGAKTSTSLPGLMQGIEADDFDEILKTAIGIPVKMYLVSDDSLGNHVGAYVIGHVTEMEKIIDEDGTNRLMATATIYKNEFPDEVAFLNNALANGEPPGISYEIDYQDSIIKNGVEWLKKMVAAAATFVRNPAYGKRTALLALASAKSDEDFNDTLRALMKEALNPDNEGGKNVEKELEEAKKAEAAAKAEAETKTARITELETQLAAKDKEIEELSSELGTIKQERVFEGRVKKLAEVGISFEAEAEKAPKKKAFYLSLDDEAFEEYLADITEIKSAAASEKQPDRKKVLASGGVEIPKPPVPSGQNGVSFKFEE